MNDDDLPVLTHVLRTGAGHDAPLWRPSLPEFDDAFDFRPIEYALTLRQYIVDAGPKDDAAPARSVDAAGDPPVLHDAISGRTTREAGPVGQTIDAVRPTDDTRGDSPHAQHDDSALESAFTAEPPQAASGEPGALHAAHDHDASAPPQHDHAHAGDAEGDRFADSPAAASDPPPASDAAPPASGTSGAQVADAAESHAPTGVPDIVADPRRLGRRDAFVLPQDTDVGPRASNDATDVTASLDAPPLAVESNDPALEPAGHDTPLHFPLRSLAERVRVAVYDDLTSRIRTELDARIAQAMHVEVENALAQMQDRLRVQLTDALRDVVGRAVDEEIARIEWTAATRETPP